jgi:hypothetical protein
MLQYSEIGIRHCNVVYLSISITIYTSIFMYIQVY